MIEVAQFGELRPRLRLLLELHGRAASEAARAAIAREFEQLFLTTAWHVARDLIDNGYEPVAAPRSTARSDAPGGLRLVDSADAA
ncbi:MAG TPA: hypothetical protein VMU93_04845 [Caulobacteraceae bacterium]|nr:hypothetical protein [Caulobacteraceae bacterium]